MSLSLHCNQRTMYLSSLYVLKSCSFVFIMFNSNNKSKSSNRRVRGSCVPKSIYQNFRGLLIYHIISSRSGRNSICFCHFVIQKGRSTFNSFMPLIKVSQDLPIHPSIVQFYFAGVLFLCLSP